MGKLLLLIDGSSLAYRSHYAFIHNPLVNSKGQSTSAVFGFTRSLKKLLEELQPDYSAVCFDHTKPTFRKKMYADYKGKRKKMPEELREQLPFIIEISEAAGLSVLINPGYEADDIIATIAEKAAREEIETVIFTSDKDLMQLIRNGITVLNMRTEGEEWIDAKQVGEKFGIPAERLVDFLSIAGDSSDNIPGIKGIGKKTASKLLKEFDSIEDIFSNLDRIKDNAIRKKLEGKKDEALKWKELIKLKKDVPLKEDLDSLKYSGINKEDLERVLKQLEFYSLIRDWVGENKGNIDYRIVDSIEIKKEEPLALLPTDGKIAVSNGESLMMVDQREMKTFFKKFKEHPFVVEDAKKLAHLLGYYPKGNILDLSVMHYLLYPNRRNHALDRILLELGLSSKNKEVQATLMAKVAKDLIHELKANDLWNLYKELEELLTPVLFYIEKKGILFDIELLTKFQNSLEVEIKELEQKICNLAGEEFNLRSSKQVGKILFEKMGLPVIKTTKTGYSTDVEVLSTIFNSNPIIPEILKFREIDKLKSSYIDTLIRNIDKKSKRVYATFQQTVASTGRIITTEPNLQTLPIRSKRGRKIRKAVIAPPGHLILSCDYSQIELRILAHLSGDEKLLEDFAKDEDIHSRTAFRIFGTESDAITSAMRRQAKAINFGIIYGISPYGLSKQLGIPQQAAGKIIETYYQAHPGVEGWQKEILDNAKDSGWVKTIYGRKRWIPELQNPRQTEYGKRIAINSPIQGSAADIIKKAMIEIHNRIEEKGLDTRMILQIHDELLFEVPKMEKEAALNLIVRTMESVTDLTIPLKVAYKFGSNWDEAH